MKDVSSKVMITVSMVCTKFVNNFPLAVLFIDFLYLWPAAKGMYCISLSIMNLDFLVRPFGLSRSRPSASPVVVSST